LRKHTEKIEKVLGNIGEKNSKKCKN